MQTQSGTSAINTVRIHNPAKQLDGQGPTGAFPLRWVPELEGGPRAHLTDLHATPGLLRPAALAAYPRPVVEAAAAARVARVRVFAVRATKAARAEVWALFLRHGSRKRTRERTEPRRAARATRVSHARGQDHEEPGESG